MRQILARLPYFCVLLDRRFRYTWINTLDPTLEGSSVLGHEMFDFLEENHRDRVRQVLETAFETKQPTYYEAPGYGSGAWDTWYGTHVVPLADEAPPLLLLLSSDVTGRRKAEEALRESEARFRRLTEASPDLVAIVDRDLQVEYINRDPKTKATDSSAVVGQPFVELIHPTDRETVERFFVDILETKNAGECELRGVAGVVYRCRAHHLSSEGAHEQVLILATDVTEQRLAQQERERLAEQLRVSQKMETIGQLAGGVAHDFNNLILMIRGQLHFARDAIAKGHNPTADLEPITDVLSRATNLTQRLLAIGHKQPHNPRSRRVVEFISSTIKLLRRVIPESITIESSFGVKDAQLLVDGLQLEQVLINLCVNARDAIGDATGTISISADRAPLPQGLAVGELEESYVAISVEDTGPGMDPGTLARVFEPFFSTKAPGKGNGLGLSMVHGVIARHGGFVDVSSEPGKGARFTLFLPEVARTTTTVQPPPERPPRAGDGQTVLLAEDEPTVRKIVTRILTKAGYRVLAAADGEEAVALLVENRNHVDIAMLDAVMPKLGGKDAYEQMMKLCPKLPVLFSSGYAADSLPQQFLEPKGVAILAKPFDPNALLTAIGDLLRATATTPKSDRSPRTGAQASPPRN